ncbi:MAG: hypothetical protein RMI63_08540, partial [Caldimicrobium sp.]|nr:hypothetical protein [Caldimicrobium sp.]
MSKLGEILRELERESKRWSKQLSKRWSKQESKKESKKESIKGPAKTYNSRKILILLGSGLLFTGSIVGGLYIVKVIEEFKSKPKRELAKSSPIGEQRPLTQPEVIKSAENQTSPTDQKRPNIKTLTQKSSSK